MTGDSIVLTAPVERTARTTLLEGMFDLEPADTATTTVAALPVADLNGRDWQIGLIVGPSGSGKTQAASAAFGGLLRTGYDWSPVRAVVDEMPADAPMKQITEVLSSVGFSSPPAWLRPFHTLSNGEQFRVEIARGLLEAPETLVVDEFTSVVDRTVAKVASHATQKAVRRRGQRMVAVSCHYDIVEWLQPDWTFNTATSHLTWGSVQPRPGVEVTIRRGAHDDWRAFSRHHYLSSSLNRSSRILLATVDDRPAAFCAVLPQPNAHFRNGYRIHRIVTLPDYQGVGVGRALLDRTAAALAACGKKVFITTTHPGLVASLNRSGQWALRRKAGRASRHHPKQIIKAATNRNTAGFRYIGPADRNIALLLTGGALTLPAETHPAT